MPPQGCRSASPATRRHTHKVQLGQLTEEVQSPKLRVQKNNEANVTGVGHYEVAWWRKYTSYSTWNYSKRPGFPLISRLPDGSVRPLLLPGSPERPTDSGFGGSRDPEQLPLGEDMERLGPKVVLQHRRGSYGATAYPWPICGRSLALSTRLPIQTVHRGVVEPGVAFWDP